MTAMKRQAALAAAAAVATPCHWQRRPTLGPSNPCAMQHPVHCMLRPSRTSQVPPQCTAAASVARTLHCLPPAPVPIVPRRQRMIASSPGCPDARHPTVTVVCVTLPSRVWVYVPGLLCPRSPAATVLPPATYSFALMPLPLCRRSHGPDFLNCRVHDVSPCSPNSPMNSSSPNGVVEVAVCMHSRNVMCRLLQLAWVHPGTTDELVAVVPPHVLVGGRLEGQAAVAPDM